MILKQYWAHTGYDAEEYYFAKVNRELIDRIKAEQGKQFKNPGTGENLAKVIPFPSKETRTTKKQAA
jgi:hypothetical protein